MFKLIKINDLVVKGLDLLHRLYMSSRDAVWWLSYMSTLCFKQEIDEQLLYIMFICTWVNSKLQSVWWMLTDLTLQCLDWYLWIVLLILILCNSHETMYISPIIMVVDSWYYVVLYSVFEAFNLWREAPTRKELSKVEWKPLAGKGNKTIKSKQESQSERKRNENTSILLPPQGMYERERKIMSEIHFSFFCPLSKKQSTGGTQRVGRQHMWREQTDKYLTLLFQQKM